MGTKKIWILSGDLKDIIFRNIIKSYKNCPFPDSFEYGGSNPFLVTAINKMLSDCEFKIPRLNEVIGIPTKYCFDLSFVLREVEEEYTTFTGKNLLAQILERKPDADFPIKIDLTDIVLEQDSRNTEFGYSFKLKENPVITSSASILNRKNGNFFNKNINIETGLPKKNNINGTRRLFNEPTEYSRDSAKSDIARLILARNGSINSYYTNMTKSSSLGRILILKND